MRLPNKLKIDFLTAFFGEGHFIPKEIETYPKSTSPDAG